MAQFMEASTYAGYVANQSSPGGKLKSRTILFIKHQVQNF